MPVFKYFGVVGSALLVFLFVSDAYRGDNESNSRFNGSLYESALYAPRLEETAGAAGFRFPPVRSQRKQTGETLPPPCRYGRSVAPSRKPVRPAPRQAVRRRRASCRAT